MVSSDDGYRTLLRRKSERINSALDRNTWCWTAVLLIVVLACYIVEDLRKKMWLDEFFTLYTAQQPSPSEIVKAKMEGADGVPPLYAIVVSRILPIVSHDALAMRLPSTLAFCGMLLCIVAFCRPRMPAVFAFIAALLVCTACPYYATEDRCYGMVLGLAAGALVC